MRIKHGALRLGRRAAIALILASLAAAGFGASFARADSGGGDGTPPGAPPAGEPLTVYAAASLTDALDEVNAAFTAATGVRVRAVYASSSLLALQIAAGAPADVFIAADPGSMDYLAQRTLLAPGSRRDVLGNQLVLITPADSPVRIKIAQGFALAGALGRRRLAVGDPQSVPAGNYARAALTFLGVWDQVSDHLLLAENVRAALAYVARGEAPLGIVYATDAQAEPRVSVVDVFPQNAYPQIRYPAAMTLTGHPQGAPYIDFLTGNAAKAIFVKRGFKVMSPFPESTL